MGLMDTNVLPLYRELIIEEQEKDFYFDLFQRGHEEIRDWLEMVSQDINATSHYYSLTIN